jgi:hypothetical protein
MDGCRGAIANTFSLCAWSLSMHRHRASGSLETPSLEQGWSVWAAVAPFIADPKMSS